jgi:hypothetical protein
MNWQGFAKAMAERRAPAPRPTYDDGIPVLVLPRPDGSLLVSVPTGAEAEVSEVVEPA